MVGRQTPETQELMRKLSELALLQSTLAQREVDRATFEIQLRVFQSSYFRLIGTRYAELDEIKAMIAEAEFAAQPDNAHLGEKAAQARSCARASQEAISRSEEEHESRFDPPEELRKLFREVAKTVHPDLADSESEKGLRQRLMTQANLAYAHGDAAGLETILSEWQSSPDAVKGEGTGAELVRAIRMMARARARLRAIAAEMASLSSSRLYELKVRVEEHETRGRDILKKMAFALDLEIAAARETLAALRRSGDPDER
jgi:hypothetical protein